MQIIRLGAELCLKSGVVVVLEQGKGGELYLRRQGTSIVYGGLSFDDAGSLEVWLATELTVPAKVELVVRPVLDVPVTLMDALAPGPADALGGALRLGQYDVNSQFDQYFHGQEGFALRSERFHAELAGVPGPEQAHLVAWLRAAFAMGARSMAQDTLSALSDYACATAGVADGPFTSEQGFDNARDNLGAYYAQIFQQTQPGAENETQ